MRQTIVTFITRVRSDRLKDLVRVLNTIDADPKDNLYLPFSQLGMVHYASLVVFEHPAGGLDLLFESNLDGSVEDYLQALMAQVPKGIEALYRCCGDYPEGGTADEVVAYLKEHTVWPTLPYVGNRGRSVDQIRREAELRSEIKRFLDDPATFAELSKLPPSGIRAAIQKFVREQPHLDWATQAPAPRLTPAERRAKAVAWAGLVSVLATLPLWLPVAAVGYAVLLWDEQRDRPPEGKRPGRVAAHLAKVTRREDELGQNHFANVVAIKRQPLRRASLLLFHWFGRTLEVPARFTSGDLLGITSIHFAHWSVIEGDRLLFLSNYDGSWGSYLDDFTEKVAYRMNAAWGHTLGFPRTRGLFWAGARKATQFKDWGRSTQVRTRAWYCAYPKLTVANIDDNSALREGLFAPLEDKATRAWLRRL